MYNYDIIIIPLSKKDGGGYFGYVSDLKGCVSDGETIEETLVNTQAAIKEWIETYKRRKLNN